MSKANSVLQKWLSKKINSDEKGKVIQNEKLESFPLSTEQVRLWVHEQLYPENPVYNLAFGYSIKGNIDLNQLRIAVESAIATHTILNCAIQNTKDGIYHVKKNTPILCETESINDASLPYARQVALLKAQSFSKKVFNIGESLIRALIISVNQKEYWIVMAVHHIIFDKQSASILIKEVVNELEKTRNGNTEEKIIDNNINEFYNYVYNSANLIQDKAKVYWKEALNPIPEPITWPFKITGKAWSNFDGKYLNIDLPKKHLDYLKDLAQKNNTSLFVVLLSIYQVFLSIYLDTKEICVGVPVTNRIDESWLQTIGFFDNSLPIKSKIDFQNNFIAQLLNTKKKVAEALSNMELPFHEIVKLTSPSRSSQNPIFQTMLIYHETDLDWTKQYPYEIEEIRIDLGVSKFDLSLYCQKKDNELELIFEISNNVFEEKRQIEIKSCFEIFLDNIIENPTIPLSKYDWLNTNRLSGLSGQYKNPEVTPLPASTITELFLSQVNKTPDAIALSDGKTNLSYTTLNNEIEALSRSLKNIGISPGSIIGICLDRSLDLIVSIYALHRIGASYLPIDPEYPFERVSQMIAIAEASTVITTSSLYQKMDFESAVLIDKKEPSLIGAIEQTNIFSEGAYVLFTSGSSGTPKGVKISQTNLVHSTQNRIHYYKKGTQNFLLIPSISFDSSVAGLFWPLCSGGTLYIPPKKIEHDLAQMAAYIQDNQINSTLLLPSLYHLLLQNTPKQMLSSLKTVIVAGETCTTDLVKLHYETLENCELYNEYGPTEATVWCTVSHLKQESDDIPIGKTLQNTQIYLLNSCMQPVLPGHIGEIYVGGMGIAEGYINNEELTADLFITNPFNEIGKLYKTGDLGRFDDEGNLYFFGRKDQQIKINGKRVELEEIAKTIKEFPGVNQATVLYQQLAKTETEQPNDLSAESFFAQDEDRAQNILYKILEKKHHLDIISKNLA